MMIFLETIGQVKVNMQRDMEMQRELTGKMKEMAAQSLRVHSANILMAEVCVLGNVRSGGLRKPCVVTWVTRTAGANGRVSPMPPFLAVVVR